MQSKNIRVLTRLLTIVTLTMSAWFMPATEIEAAENCSDQYYINETLPNGSTWDMCWEHRQREGIIFHHVFYKPKDGIRRMILNHAAVAQIHVPYDDNGARYHDVSDFGIGGKYLVDMNLDECPSGTNYPVTYSVITAEGTESFTKNGLCKQIVKNDLGYKSGQNAGNENYLNLFSVSAVGAYYYIPTWRFMEDGSIEPWMGATGALQRFSEEENRGWKMGDDRIGLAHLHNFYWKLDFDLNNTHLDDVVEEVNFSLINGKRSRQTTVFNQEAAREVNPSTMRHWRVSDNSASNENGNKLSYDILLNESGHQDIGPDIEPFTFNDFYVTKQNDQERFASHNPSGGQNLAEYVNGESIENIDTVIWAGVTFYHMPRSEDAPQMDAHWSHLKIVPRDLSAHNPLSGSAIINSAPSVSSISPQSTPMNSDASLTIQASDMDSDSLSYSAFGLPAGLVVNSITGKIFGKPSELGEFKIQVTVRDSETSSSALFTWTVTESINSAPSISSIPNQSTPMDSDASLNIVASDIDGDLMSYSVTGLPTGLVINSISGRIFGTPTQLGEFQVQVTVRDNETSSSASFTWTVTEKIIIVSSGGGGGSMGLFALLFFLLLIAVRTHTRVARDV